MYKENRGVFSCQMAKVDTHSTVPYFSGTAHIAATAYSLDYGVDTAISTTQGG